jgi:hypothetical protein
MKPAVLLLVLSACGNSTAGQLRISTTFTITQLDGTGPSVLDPLNGQTITLVVNMDSSEVFHAQSAGCKSTILGKSDPPRKASGEMAALVQTEVLDKIPNWNVQLELCSVASGSRIAIDASIDELNTTFGCLMVPTAAQIRSGDDNPQLTTFVGEACSATILDVVNNRVLGAQGFTISFDTAGQRIP